MSRKQRGLLIGLFFGSLGIIPLIMWLSDLRLSLSCPGCDREITARKPNRSFSIEVK